MKYLLGFCLIFALQSCGGIYNSNIVNEYLDFPKGLDKKQFMLEIAARNKELEKIGDSLVNFSSLNKKKLLPTELFYFNNTLIPIKELKSVDSLVNLLTAIPYRKLMWSNMDYKIHGIKGERYWFTKKSTRNKINAKVDDIMNQLRNKLKFKYNSSMIFSYPFYLCASRQYNSIPKRLIKMKKL